MLFCSLRERSPKEGQLCGSYGVRSKKLAFFNLNKELRACSLALRRRVFGLLIMMNQKITPIFFFCLVSICGFGKEPLSLFQLSQEGVSISVAPKEPLIEETPKELFAESFFCIIQPPSEDDMPGRVVYPVEESNFKEVFRRKP